MNRFLRSVFAAGAVFLCVVGAVQAKPKAEVVVGVMVMRVDSERIDDLASNVESGDAAALLRSIVGDASTEIAGRSQQRASDGTTLHWRVSHRTVSSLPNTDFVVDVTPQLGGSREVFLHVEITVPAEKQYRGSDGRIQTVAGQRKSITDIRLGEGEVTLLGGVKVSSPAMVRVPALGDDRHALLLALIPHILRADHLEP